VLIELDPVERITADAVGEPGQRTFYLQGRKGSELVTILVEKQQVQLLAASVLEILARVGKETLQGPPEEVMGLEDPVEPEWRAGRLSIGYQEERDLVMLEVQELLPGDEDEDEDDEEDEEEDEDEDDDQDDEEENDEEEDSDLDAEVAELLGGDPARGRVRFWATREQMLSLARHGAAVCAAGRPRCQFCNGPIDPEGHVCPAMNGHRPSGD
jgi:uncharacterized repeat protein (TIGR03847 family)